MIRRLLRTLLLLLVAVLLVIGFVARRIPQPAIEPGLTERPADPAHGRYVATLGDCAGCHSLPGGADYAGGRAFPTPLGRVIAGNITPDPETGIGAYDFTDFVRLMRFGVAPGGKWITPAMPFTAYAKLSDADLWDLFAFLRQDVAPLRQATPSRGIFSLKLARAPLALWTRLFHRPTAFAADPAHDRQWNRGAYLVQGPGHCGTCHTPRNEALAERDVDGSSTLFLSGTAFAGGAPINLRGNDGDGLGRWSAADIAQLLKTGRNAQSAVSGAMAEVVGASTQYFSDDDLAAIAAYLKSLPPADDQGRGHFTPDGASLEHFLSGREDSPGGRIFMDSCAACHRLAGSGAAAVFPGLAGNPSILSRDPSSLIAVILVGTRLPSTAAAPSPLAMPGFGWRYDDEEIAALASFIRNSWGNHASPVSAAQVAQSRRIWSRS